VKTLDGNKPKEIIEEVQSQQEEAFFARIKTDNFNYAKIKKAWQDCEKSNYRDTIRDIQNVEVCLVSDQNFEEVKDNPYQFQTISIFKWSLVGWLKKSEEENDFEDWLAKELTESVILDMGEEGEYDLTEVKDYQKLPSLVYLNADHFGYSPEVGFNRDFPDTFQNTSPLKNLSKAEESTTDLQKDTFIEHNLGLINCFKQEYLPKLDFALKELITYLELEEISKEDLINIFYLMFILHDYGKLNKDWQIPMQKYQGVKEILAHTDYSREKPTDIERSKNAGLHKRPAHAPIGAHVFLKAFENYHEKEELEELKIAIAYSIGKHHSSKIDGEIRIPEYSIPENCYNAFQELLAKFDLRGAFPRTGYPGRLEEQIDEGSPHEMIPYFFYVRILRLCDQKATKNLRKYLNNG
jgi:CRISPR-associated endonuclease/helicase Cas3